MNLNKECFCFHLTRAKKFPEQVPIRHISQPITWARGARDSHTKKGRHVSAEVLTMHSVPAHHTVSVPISHLVPAQSDMNLHGKDNGRNMVICKDQTLTSVGS
jgi:hypothetical protein